MSWCFCESESASSLSGRSSPSLEPSRKTPTLEHAVQTAPVARPAVTSTVRSPGAARPALSTQKSAENQEQKGENQGISWRNEFFHLLPLIVNSVVQLQHLMLRRFLGQNRTQTGLITKTRTNGSLVVSHFIMPVLHWHMWPWSTKHKTCFVMIGQYLAEMQLFENLSEQKKI